MPKFNSPKRIYERQTCCCGSNAIVNFLLVLWGAYSCSLIAAWALWTRENSPSWPWQNIILTSYVWVGVASWIACVAFIALLRIFDMKLDVIKPNFEQRQHILPQNEPATFKVVDDDEQAFDGDTRGRPVDESMDTDPQSEADNEAETESESEPPTPLPKRKIAPAPVSIPMKPIASMMQKRQAVARASAAAKTVVVQINDVDDSALEAEVAKITKAAEAKPTHEEQKRKVVQAIDNVASALVDVD